MYEKKSVFDQYRTWFNPVCYMVCIIEAKKKPSASQPEITKKIKFQMKYIEKLQNNNLCR